MEHFLEFIDVRINQTDITNLSATCESNYSLADARIYSKDIAIDDLLLFYSLAAGSVYLAWVGSAALLVLFNLIS